MRDEALHPPIVHQGRLSALLDTPHLDKPETPRVENPAETIVWGFLAWECAQPRAASAYERLRSRVVDLNELRVCFTDEIRSMIGDRYPRSRKRASRIRRVLQDIRRREYAVNLDRLSDLPASDAATYLLKLDGMLPYVAAFTCVHALSHGVIPIDTRLHSALIEEGIAHADASPEAIGDAIAEQIEPEQCAAAHLLLWSWIDSRDQQPRRTGDPRSTGDD